MQISKIVLSSLVAYGLLSSSLQATSCPKINEKDVVDIWNGGQKGTEHGKGGVTYNTSIPKTPTYKKQTYSHIQVSITTPNTIGDLKSISKGSTGGDACTYTLIDKKKNSIGAIRFDW